MPTAFVKTQKFTDNTTVFDTPPLSALFHPLLPLLGYSILNEETIASLLVVLNNMPSETYYSQVEKLYQMPALVRPVEGNRFINPAKDLLVHVARKYGRVGKKGPNLNAAAEIVLDDCLRGRITWWMECPKDA